VWLPAARPEYAFGLVQLANGAASSRHSNVPLSVDVKLKLADVELVGFNGLAVIDVSGGAVSIVHVLLAGVGSTFPAGSVALTWNVWPPAASPVYGLGLVQPANAAPSRLHWNVEPVSLDEKLKLGLVELLGFAGLAVIVVSGGVVSIVHV
jgi:hypothetical protein